MGCCGICINSTSNAESNYKVAISELQTDGYTINIDKKQGYLTKQISCTLKQQSSTVPTLHLQDVRTFYKQRVSNITGTCLYIYILLRLRETKNHVCIRLCY